MGLAVGTYIAVEGAIGAGKTSLARILAEEFEAQFVKEEADGNPFLVDYYRDPRRYALQVQLNFLLSRHRQQSELKQINIFNQTVISDYIFEKDSIFAHLNLDDRELRLYNQIAVVLAEDVPTPSLVVFLQASPERLMTNIRVRDISYEQAITAEYLKHLCEAYYQFFFHWDKSPLLMINTTRMDFVNDAKHRRSLVEAIEKMPPGTTYLNPEV